MTENIVVTGGTGFIGSHVVDMLLDEGHEVVVLSRRPKRSEFPAYVNKNAKIISYEDYLSETHSFDVSGLIHLATNYKKDHSLIDIEPMVHSNVTMPLMVADKAFRDGAHFIINFGTFFRYETTNFPISETSRVKPYDLYAASKLSFESALDFFATKYGIQASTLVLFSPYGPRDNSNKLIPYVIKSLLSRRVLHLSFGLQRLDFTYVSDIVKAVILILKKMKSSTAPRHEIFNLGTGKARSVRDVVSIIEEITDMTVVKKWSGHDPDQDISITSNSEKAFKSFNWKAETDLREGLIETIDYYREGEYENRKNQF